MNTLSILLISLLTASYLSACSQSSKEDSMRGVTETLLIDLKNCDTTKILSLYDVSASHIEQENYRSFVKQQIVSNCTLFNKLVKKDPTTYLKNLSFTNDPKNGSNVAVLPIMTQPDTTMNLKGCTLYIMFYPDQFFNGKILRFTMNQEYLKQRETPKLKLPPSF